MNAELRTDRHHDGAQLRGGQRGDDPLDAVRQVDRDAIAHAEPQFGESSSQGGRVRVHLLIGPRPFTIRSEHARGMLLRTLLDQGGEGPRRCHSTPGSGTAT